MRISLNPNLDVYIIQSLAQLQFGVWTQVVAKLLKLGAAI